MFDVNVFPLAWVASFVFGGLVSISLPANASTYFQGSSLASFVPVLSLDNVMFERLAPVKDGKVKLNLMLAKKCIENVILGKGQEVGLLKHPRALVKDNDMGWDIHAEELFLRPWERMWTNKN